MYGRMRITKGHIASVPDCKPGRCCCDPDAGVCCAAAIFNKSGLQILKAVHLIKLCSIQADLCFSITSDVNPDLNMNEPSTKENRGVMIMKGFSCDVFEKGIEKYR